MFDEFSERTDEPKQKVSEKDLKNAMKIMANMKKQKTRQDEMISKRAAAGEVLAKTKQIKIIAAITGGLSLVSTFTGIISIFIPAALSIVLLVVAVYFYRDTVKEEQKLKSKYYAPIDVQAGGWEF